MNLSAENISKIRELVRSGYPLKARDAQDLQGHNDHLIELLEARFRLMLGLEIERDQLKVDLGELATKHAECAEFIDQACLDAAPLDAVDGDQLPPIGSNVLIHLGRPDAWVEHTVAGYYAWGDLGGNENLSRVFVRVRDEAGCLNARLLKDVKPSVASVLGPVVSVPKELMP
jgi:hypothetical protein